MNRGIIYAATAYSLWGFFPVYWKLLGSVTALEIIAHRMVWSLVFLAIVVTLRRRWNRLQEAARRPRNLVVYLVTATLLAGNWLVYVWAINSDFVVETSLGYFINPLVNVLLGVLFLREHVRPWQWLSIAIATTGVLALTVSYGRLPWIALTLAATFGSYGLLRKTGALNAIDGLTVEMAILFIPAVSILLVRQSNGVAAFGHISMAISLLLVLAGIVTAGPLLLFAAGARRIKLVTLGLLQYIAPSIQLVLAVVAFHEPFATDRVIGFAIIWSALLVYSVEGFVSSRKRMDLRYAP